MLRQRRDANKAEAAETDADAVRDALAEALISALRLRVTRALLDAVLVALGAITAFWWFVS